MDFRIGTAAKRLRCSEAALRLWERQGKIPTARRTRTGYRQYTEAEIAAIERAIFGNSKEETDDKWWKHR